MNPEEYLAKLIENYVKMLTDLPTAIPVFKIETLNFEMLCQHLKVNEDRLKNTRALTVATPVGMMRLEKN